MTFPNGIADIANMQQLSADYFFSWKAQSVSSHQERQQLQLACSNVEPLVVPLADSGTELNGLNVDFKLKRLWLNFRIFSPPSPIADGPNPIIAWPSF